MKQWLMLLPNVVRLTYALMKDPRTPLRAKITLGAAYAYFLTPIDLIPDWIPLLGYLDDFILAMVLLDGLLNQVDRKLVEEHWKGSAEMLRRAGRAAHYLSSFVPRSIKRRLFNPKVKPEDVNLNPPPPEELPKDG
jgi:uncharacterized membrane protein YkvA (DUF1232 family)